MFSEKLRQLWETVENPDSGQTYTVPEIAIRTGIGIATWYRYLDGGNAPNAKKMLSLAELFGVSIDYLIDDSIPIQNSPRRIILEEIKLRTHRLKRDDIEQVIANLQKQLQQLPLHQPALDLG